MFVDEAVIKVRGGNGGKGAVSFRREKYVEWGGPDGGDGGKGGDVVLRASTHYNTLHHLSSRKVLCAGEAGAGSGKKHRGKNGKDLVLDVPVGTQVYSHPGGLLYQDLSRPGQTLVVSRGGQGGKGNTRFASSTLQAPKFSEPGEEGEERELRLELKILADVGLIGCPNAGKSSLLRRLSASRTKVGAYPFTTLHPSLGVVAQGNRSLVMADLPGLLAGAHEGYGLGDRFLRHIERTRVLVQLVDLSAEDPAGDWKQVQEEMSRFNPGLLEKPLVVAANKIDLPSASRRVAAFRKKVGRPVFPISALTGKGLPELVEAVFSLAGGAPTDA